MSIETTLSYDDILLVPGYSELTPGETDLRTRLVADIFLSIPLLSAAMDTVTEKELAIAIALEGGAGVIHRNLTPQQQADHVAAVKRYLNWVIEDPITVKTTMTVEDVRRITREYGISGLPVVDDNNILKGIITGRDLRFCKDDSLKVQQVMTPNPISRHGQAEFGNRGGAVQPVQDRETPCHRR
jgi:IMP dehydrogenase